MKRQVDGFTLIELLVVIAIISILAAILFPVFATAREKARQTTCTSNLKQFGYALAMYREDFDEINARYRFCGAGTTSRDSALDAAQGYPYPDPLCRDLINPTTYTGAAETWWAPYDNDTSAGGDNAQPTSPYSPSWVHYTLGFLYPYVKSADVFHDPSASQFQCGYAMSYIYYGPMGLPDSKVTNPAALVIWDHSKTPGCADTTGTGSEPSNSTLNSAQRPMVPIGANQPQFIHYPNRHNGGFVGLAYDGSVKWRVPSNLTSKDFMANAGSCAPTDADCLASAAQLN